jgi:hypothetical protein
VYTTRVNCAIFADCTDDDDDAHRSSVAVAVAAVAAVAAVPSSSVRRVRPSTRCGGIRRDEECDVERWDRRGLGTRVVVVVVVWCDDSYAHMPIRKNAGLCDDDDDDDDDDDAC